MLTLKLFKLLLSHLQVRLSSGDKYRIPRIADHPAQPLSREQATGDPGTTSPGLHCASTGHLYLTPLSCTLDEDLPFDLFPGAEAGSF